MNVIHGDYSMRKKIALTVGIGLTTLVLVIVTVMAFSMLNKVPNGKDNSKGASDKALTAATEMEAGLKLENTGKTKEALERYKAAKSLCEPSDQLCLANSQMKIGMMEVTIENEKSVIRPPVEPKSLEPKGDGKTTFPTEPEPADNNL